MLNEIPAPVKNAEILKSLVYFLERKFTPHSFVISKDKSAISFESRGEQKLERNEVAQAAAEFVGDAGRLSSRVKPELILRSETAPAERPKSTTEVFEGVVKTDIDGVVFLKTPEAQILQLLDSYFAAFAETLGAKEVLAPALVSRQTLERAGYLKKDAHQVGHVHLENGEHVGCLSPAACLTTYPIVALSGLTKLRSVFTLNNRVFRMEGNVFPTDAPMARLREYQVREIIFFGDSGLMSEVRERYFEFMKITGERFAIPFEIASATDTFFHSESTAMALHQLLNKTKYEMSFTGATSPLALSSLNFHDTLFTKAFNIVSEKTELNEPPKSACIGFGLERWVRALLVTHPSSEAVIKILKKAIES